MRGRWRNLELFTSIETDSKDLTPQPSWQATFNAYVWE
jgi:hypothetical protein